MKGDLSCIQIHVGVGESKKMLGPRGIGHSSLDLSIIIIELIPSFIHGKSPGQPQLLLPSGTHVRAIGQFKW